MTQKEALQNIIKSLDHPALKRLFICNWLEDINWHRECTLLQNNFSKYDIENFEKMEKMKDDIETREWMIPFRKYDYENAETRLLPGFVHVFGWGIKPSEWTSGGDGPKFVEELEAMVKVAD